jgi:hypothetical protein
MKTKKLVAEAQWVRRWIRKYGIQLVRDGLIEYVLDRVEGNEWEALRVRLECGQVRLSTATTPQLISELEDWSVASKDKDMEREEFERVEDFIRPKLEGEARPTKEGTK